MSNETNFADRLKLARETQRYSRSALAETTGIPEKSIEKFEYGTMEPNVTRLQKLAEVLQVTTSYLLEGEEVLPWEEETKETTEPDHLHDFDDLEAVMTEFEAIDKMREAGFQNSWRTAPRTLSFVQKMLNTLEFDQLLDLAEHRSLLAISDEEVFAFDQLELSEQDLAHEALVERIIDTAYFGIDLFKIKQSALEKLAAINRIKCDKTDGLLGMFDTWSCFDAVVASIRPVIREQALKGMSPDFVDDTRFPLKEVA